MNHTNRKLYFQARSKRWQFDKSTALFSIFEIALGKILLQYHKSCTLDCMAIAQNLNLTPMHQTFRLQYFTSSLQNYFNSPSHLYHFLKKYEGESFLIQTAWIITKFSFYSNEFEECDARTAYFIVVQYFVVYHLSSPLNRLPPISSCGCWNKFLHSTYDLNKVSYYKFEWKLLLKRLYWN